MISSTQVLETTQHDSRKNSKPAINSKKWADGHSGSGIIRGHEIKPVDMLLSLEKKPLECYFEGLRKKPSRRRKIRQPKNKCLDFLEPDSSALENEGWISTLSGVSSKERERNDVEDRLLGNLTHMKMKTYEKIKEYKQEKISMKQRLAEKSYLEQQENLAETWLGVMKRRSQLRKAESEDFLSCPRPTFRTSSSKRNTRIEISLLSKKFWSDEKGTSQGAGEEICRHVGNNNINAFSAIEEAPLQKKEESSVLDNLDEVFGEKLVFIDDED